VAGLFEAYVSGAARAFYAGDVSQRDDRARAVERASRPLSPRVLARLRAQNQPLGPSAARAAGLAALEAGACAVVTGQQVGLFLGPLFTLYKAATAIALARQLESETGRAAVPVFWLQTEDHDLPEIARCVLPRAGDGEAPCVLAPQIDADNRVSIAHLALPAAVSDSLSQLRLELGRLPHASEHVARLTRHYQPGRGWAQAFAGVIAELFEAEGLLLLDPRDPELAAEAAHVTAAALERSSELGQLLCAQGAALEREGFAQTVHVRPDSPLTFFHPQGAHGPRTRLLLRGGAFVEPDTGRAHVLPELMDRLAREPLAFSSSALLRPLVQDSLLPTAAYVGGPAEVAYYAQLPPLYRALGMSVPFIAPRARVRLIEPRTRRLLERLGLSAADVSRDEAQLLAGLEQSLPPSAADAVPLPSAAAVERQLLQGFEAALTDALAPLPEALRRDLARQIDKTRSKLVLTAGKLSRAYGQHSLRRDSARVAQVQRLKQLLHPNDAPQERVFGLPYFGACYGDRALAARVLEAVVPHAPAQILELSL